MASMSRRVLEKHVEGKVTLWAKNNGWLTYKWATGMGGTSGVPDRLFIPPGCRGVVMAIEFKRPGNKPTTRQILVMDKLSAQGMLVSWHDDANAAIQWLQKQRVEHCD